jgi:hypothetical protein
MFQRFCVLYKFYFQNTQCDTVIRYLHFQNTQCDTVIIYMYTFSKYTVWHCYQRYALNFQFSDWLCHGGVGSLQIHTINRFYTSWTFIPCCEWSYHGFLKLSLPRHPQHCYHNLTLRPFYLSLTLSHFLILKFKHSVMTWTQVIDGWEGGASGFLKRGYVQIYKDIY